MLDSPLTGGPVGDGEVLYLELESCTWRAWSGEWSGVGG